MSLDVEPKPEKGTSKNCLQLLAQQFFSHIGVSAKSSSQLGDVRSLWLSVHHPCSWDKAVVCLPGSWARFLAPLGPATISLGRGSFPSLHTAAFIPTRNLVLLPGGA